MHLQQRTSALTSTSRQGAQPVVASVVCRSHKTAVAAAATACVAAPAAAGIGHSSSATNPQQQQHHHLSTGSGLSSRRTAVVTSAAATASVDLEELIGPAALEPEVFEIVTYALKLAWTSETYYVHSWMVLLGLLKRENSIACDVSSHGSCPCLVVGDTIDWLNACRADSLAADMCRAVLK